MSIKIVGDVDVDILLLGLIFICVGRIEMNELGFFHRNDKMSNLD